MKRMNKEGPAPRSEAGIRESGTRLAETVRGGALVIDTRPAEEFAKGHVPGTLNIPLGGSFVTWAGWLIPYDRDFYVVTDRIDDARRALMLIGLDRIAGYFLPSAAGGNETIDQMSVEELAKKQPSNGLVLIDVRNDSEWNEGHIPNAIHIPLGQLAQRVGEIPAGDEIVVQCQSGNRSAIAASLLQQLGRKNVANLSGGYRAWQAR